MPDASPRPWKISGEYYIRDADDTVILGCSRLDDAPLIVRSVNAAEDLAKSLREIVSDMEFHTGGDLSGWTELGRARVERARAALKKWEENDG